MLRIQVLLATSTASVKIDLSRTYCFRLQARKAEKSDKLIRESSLELCWERKFSTSAIQCFGNTLLGSLALGVFIISHCGLGDSVHGGSPVERYLAGGCQTRLKWNSIYPSNEATKSSSLILIHRLKLCFANFFYDCRKITDVRLILGWYELSNPCFWSRSGW